MINYLIYFITLVLSHPTAPPDSNQIEEIVVVGEQPTSASSDQALRDYDFKLFPKKTASDLMRLIPGLHITQHTGGAKAHQIFLRGFDAEHGQDVAASLNGIPLNEVSHVHGQGYLDLHFLIPEVIHQISIRKGPYDAGLGSFSTGGAIHFRTSPQLEDTAWVRLGYGSFDSQSILSRFSLQNDGYRANLALQGEKTQGFTQPGHLRAFRAFAHAQSGFESGWSLDVLYAGYAARSQAADTLPKSMIDDGSIDRYSSLDASNRVDVDRHLGGAILKGPWADGQLESIAYYNFKDTRIFSNFTYFYFDPVHGDQLEQSDRRHYGGLQSTYARNDELDQLGLLASELGIAWRMDRVSQTQANTDQRVRTNVINNYRFDEHNLGMHADLHLQTHGDWMLAAGMRYDLNFIQLDGTQDERRLDIQTNQVVVDDDHPRNISSDAHVFSPKLSIVYTPVQTWKMFFNFGRGFITRPARDQADRPLHTAYGVTGAELASHLSMLENRLHLIASLWWAHKESELLFDPEFGQSVFRGQSHRLGTELEARYCPFDWLWLAVDLFYIHARFKDPGGDWTPIPNAPAFLMTNLLSIRHPRGYQLSVRGRMVGRRNHDLGLSSKPYYIMDLVAAWENDSFILSLEAQNLFDIQWYDSVFAYPVRPAPDAPVDRGLQVTAGTPLAAQMFFTLKI